MDAVEVRRVFADGKLLGKTLIEKLDGTGFKVGGDFLSTGMYLTDRDGIISLMRGKIKYLSEKNPDVKYHLR